MGVVKAGVGSKICLKNIQTSFNGARVLLQTIPVLVSSRLHSHLVSVSYGFDRHVTDTVGCYNYFTRSIHKKH
jgi:hypothetical protein